MCPITFPIWCRNVTLSTWDYFYQITMKLYEILLHELFSTGARWFTQLTIMGGSLSLRKRNCVMSFFLSIQVIHISKRILILIEICIKIFFRWRQLSIKTWRRNVKYRSCAKLIKILRTLGTVFHILWLFAARQQQRLLSLSLSLCASKSGTLSNFIAGTTFKDLQKKFRISITLRFLIVPLRRGSFKWRHPTPSPPSTLISIPNPILPNLQSSAPLVIETVASALQEFRKLVFKTGTNYSKLLLTFFSDRYFFFYSSTLFPGPTQKFYEDIQRACQRFGNWLRAIEML